MKINDLMGDIINKYNKQSKVVDKNQLKKSSQSKPVAESNTVKGDKVEISKDAKILLQLDSYSDKTDRLREIKLAINNGTYRPNIEETAKAILKEWLGE